jgi:hypothetical protein
VKREEIHQIGQPQVGLIGLEIVLGKAQAHCR